MRPFGWTGLGARWLLEAFRPGAINASVCLRQPVKADQAYFLRGYLQALFSRWVPGGEAWGRTGRRSIANVGKVRGGAGSPKGPGGGGGSGLHRPGASGGSSAAEAANDSFVAHIARRYAYRDTPAATLSRQSLQRVLALRQCVPLLSFAGLCLVDKPSAITPDEELEGVCFEIRKIFDKINFDISNREVLPVPADKPVSLANFELGDPIAKGCNAVVYSARMKRPEEMVQTISKPIQIPTIEEEPLDAVEPGSPPLSTSPPRKYDSALEAPSGTVDTSVHAVPSGPLGPHDLALKMMFNYDAESNAAAIWQSLSRECASLQTAASGDDEEHNELISSMASAMAKRDTHLPPHPCIVEIKAAFVDRVPMLRGATQLYPNALPPRLHEQGIGRNATMFLVMKRYNCSLRHYLRSGAIDSCQRPDRVRLSFCTQIFEAVAHLVAHGVAHRDMKSDNILVELPDPNEDRQSEPRIALTDFGCCLIPADCIATLKLAFISGQISRGGNMALMSPEVLSAKPGLLGFIDYSKADLWSAATLVYEVYGQPNPFYEGNLRSSTYKEANLPPLDGAPPELRALVSACLQRDPSQRPSPTVAATVLQLLLHAPKRLLKPTSPTGDFGISIRHVVEWLCDISVDSIFAARREEDKEKTYSVDQMLKRVFLGRVQLQTVLDALKFIRSAQQAMEDNVEQDSEVEDDCVPKTQENIA